MSDPTLAPPPSCPISLLPPELLYAILAHACWVPPHVSLQFRYTTLLRTALVHSSWRAPSQHLLALRVSLFGFTPGSRAEQLLETGGPGRGDGEGGRAGWVCDELELGGIASGRGEVVKGVVGRARRVRSLRFHALFAGGVPSGLFELEGLEDLESLHISRADLSPALSLPRRLTTLSLPATSAPPSTDPTLRRLLTLNAPTLKTLRLQLNLLSPKALDSMLPALLLVAPTLLSLSLFILPAFLPPPGTPCPPSLVALLAACTSLERLELSKLPVDNLVPLFSALPLDHSLAQASSALPPPAPTSNLRALILNLPGGGSSASGDGGQGTEHESAYARAQATAGAMAKVAGLPGLKSLRKWEVVRRESQWEAEGVWREARRGLEDRGTRVEMVFEK